MVRLLIAATLAASFLSVSAAISQEGFQTILSDLGYGRFSDAFKSVANANPAFFSSLGSGEPFTVYVPVNEAWNGVADGDLEKVLAYHISPSPLNTTAIAPPRQHTIAYTQLRKDQSLPGSQTQVLVLETSPVDNDRVLIRGADWNATSTGPGRAYENIFIQPINRIISPPLPLLDVLRLPLDGSAIQGTPAAIATINNIGLVDVVTSCKGCTFFIPNDAALASVNLTGLTTAQASNIFLTHVINGDVRYSPELDPGNTWISASGQTVAYGVKATGSFITSGGAVARIMRSDILTDNGVVHVCLSRLPLRIKLTTQLVNRVIGGPQGNPERAASALSAASNAAATQTTVEGIIGRIPTSIPATATNTFTAGPFATSQGAALSRLSRGLLFRLLALLG